MAKTTEQAVPDGLLSFVVVGELPIVDAVTKQSVRKPGVVQLDPEKTLIEPLIEYGLIKPLPAAEG